LTKLDKKKIQFVLLLIVTISSNVSIARQKFATLPGGLLYPQFATSAFTNAAALTSEWYSEAEALYSPSLSNQLPTHSYLVGYATGNPKFGFNLGYFGSVQSAVATHNLFVGISKRFKKHSLGLSVRKNDLVYSNDLPVDVSWMWDISKGFSMGVVAYDIVENRSLAAGVGYQDLSSNSLELDVQFPLPGYPAFRAQEYAINIASVVFLNTSFGMSLGTRYQRRVAPGSESSTLRHTIGSVLKIKGQVSLLSLYTSSPDTFTVGLCWGSPATAKQWTDYWLARDRQGLNQ
jgi:hypothetical protein